MKNSFFHMLNAMLFGYMARMGFILFESDVELKNIIENGIKRLDDKIDAKLKEYEEQREKDGAILKSTADALKSLTDQHKALSDALTELAQKGVKAESQPAMKSIGTEFIESDAFKSFKDGGTTKARVEIKNTILGESGSPQNPDDTLVGADRLPGIVGGAFRSLRLLDVIPVGTTGSNSIEYTREASWTNDAAETKEGAAKPESDLTFELVNVPVRTIAHFIKVSKQVMDDAPALGSYIDRRLRHGVQNRLQTQIVNGNGTSPNISGILDAGNYTSLSAATGDNKFDFANKAKYKVVEAEYEPTVYLINPQDWGAMERLKRGTGDEGYVGGDGGVISYLQNGLQPTLWGLPVIASNAVPQGTLICLASDAVMMWQRQGVVVEVFEQDGDNVQKNLLTVRAEMRGAFSVFRPAAVVAGTLPS
jgi:HK97 family phage major capsid protein